MIMMIRSITHQEVPTAISTQIPLPTQRPTTLNYMMRTTRGARNILLVTGFLSISNTQYININSLMMTLSIHSTIFVISSLYMRFRFGICELLDSLMLLRYNDF
ncbi:Transcription regulator [Saccharolobus solfataricus P2]|uniref:Transcription regulator n=2 Tax=Saccharolobus solfataricus TaxID=2287 RepID=Q97XX2_SACS2|nr:Transcription regulator [Saccharolobus solfataricus P2]SAI85264.1 transcriptional regulator [Saccharolobus solfataricus]